MIESLLKPNVLLTFSTSHSVGGTLDFICKAVINELTWRAFQDYKNQHAQTSWHVVVLPDSNISNEPRFNVYYGDSPTTHDYPVATALRPTQQNRPNGRPAVFFQQSHQTNQQPMFSQQNPGTYQQPLPTQNYSLGGYGRGGPSVAPSQQSRFTTPMPGSLRSGGGSIMAIPQQQFYSQTPQQGSFQGVDPNTGPDQGNHQGQVSYPGQGNNMMFNRSSGTPMGSLPQVHRPVFDQHGYIVGEEGNTNDGNMYDRNVHGSNMYRSNTYSNNMVGPVQSVPFQRPQQQMYPTQQPQNADTSDPQLTAAAQSFLSFIKDKIDHHEGCQDEDDQGDGVEDEAEQESIQAEVDQDQREQDEGVALGNTSSNNPDTTTAATQPAVPRKPAPALSTEHLKALQASDKEPHRFADNTGMNLCDYCGRDGHEAAACLKWDPTHFDKPVCTACNNDQHSLDECPKFRAMTVPQRQALLLGEGGRRPGVRSDYHAWTDYLRPGDNRNKEGGGGFPLTRLFLQDLSLDRDSGAMLTNIWKVWDYGRGVPDRFLDPRAEMLASYPMGDLDERFKGGEHKLGWKMPVPRSVRRQHPYKRHPQHRNVGGEEGGEDEL